MVERSNIHIIQVKFSTGTIYSDEQRSSCPMFEHDIFVRRFGFCRPAQRELCFRQSMKFKATGDENAGRCMFGSLLKCVVSMHKPDTRKFLFIPRSRMNIDILQSYDIGSWLQSASACRAAILSPTLRTFHDISLIIEFAFVFVIASSLPGIGIADLVHYNSRLMSRMISLTSIFSGR